MVSPLHNENTAVSLWNSTLAHEPEWIPFYTFEWQQLWSRAREKSWTPFFVHTNIAGDHIAAFERRGNAVRFSGGEEIADYMDIAGSQDGKVAAWKDILAYLKNDGIKTVNLRNVPESSPTVKIFHGQLQKEDTTPRFSLPVSWVAYLDQLESNTRHGMKQKMRKFERIFEEPRIVRSRTPEKDLATLLTLMKLNKHKRVFLTQEMERLFAGIPKAFPKNTIIYKLEVEGVVAASVLGFSDGHTLFLYNSGYDDANYPGAGFYLAASSIRSAIEAGHTEYNFLQGNERYKYELGAKDFFVYKATITL